MTNRSTETEIVRVHEPYYTGSLPTIPASTNAPVLRVDEGQFFANVAEFCKKMSNERKIVVVATLDGTFKREPSFGTVLDLIPLAENIVKLNAESTIRSLEAAFTKKRGINWQLSPLAIEVIWASPPNPEQLFAILK